MTTGGDLRTRTGERGRTYVPVILICVGALVYFAWPTILGWVDVQERRIAPDISAVDLHSIYRELEPNDRKLMQAFVSRNRPNGAPLGDWGKRVTVREAIASETRISNELAHSAATARTMVVRANEAQQKLSLRMIESRLRIGSTGAPEVVGVFSQGHEESVAEFEGVIVFFVPPVDIRACLRVRASGAFLPRDKDELVYALTPDLGARYSELRGDGVHADFVPTKVKFFGGKTEEFDVSRALCPS